MLQQCTIKAPNGALGLNLSRAPWDPYPWVSGVQAKSNAELGGVCIGDTLLQLNGRDVLGMRISELATRLREHWLSGADQVTLMMWRQEPNPALSGDDPIEAAHAVQHGINQQSLQKFATCLQHIAQLLECPVCCDVIKPPSWQCCNGHVLCNNCRNRSVKCPVCRVPLGPRGRCLLSDNLFTLLAENFPCDGVKANNSNNNKSGNKKCTTEYHNQPKMALTKSNTIKKSRKTSRQMHSAVISVVNDAEGVEVAAEAAVIECVKQVGGRPQGNEQTVQILKNNVNDGAAAVTAATQQQQQHNNNMLVKPKLKLSKKSWQITGRGDQDELHSDEVANINNGQQQAREGGQVLKPSKGQQQYQNYHCPTGKSCNSSSSNSSNSQAKLCNKLSTVKQEPNTTESAVYEKLTLLLLPSAFSEIAFPSLSASNQKEDHDKRQPSIKKTLQHFHGTFNQRLHVHVQLGAEPLPASLRLNEAHTFFLAALAIAGVRGDEKDTYAVFLWHLNEQEEEQESQQFQTIIESECSRVKWFGSAQPHTRSWQEISAAGEYLTWSNSIKNNNNCTTFDIIIKKKAPLV